MATLVTFHNFRDRYRDLVSHVLEHGTHAEPRGLATRDVGPTLVTVLDPREALPLGVGRGLDPRIAAVEAAMLLGAFCDEELIGKIAPRLLDYADEEPDSRGVAQRRLHGAYGRRIGYQLQCAVRKLRQDFQTRQAVITLWDPWLDNLPAYRDYPCTVGLQLRARNGRLDLEVTMRSNDVWRGIPYDVFQFTQLQLAVARALDVPVGSYYHLAWSLHIYESDVKRAEQMLESEPTPVVRDGETRPPGRPYQPDGIGRPGDSLEEIQRRVRALAVGARIDGMTVAEGWYGEYLTTQLTPHVG